jgi:hypothetical protein
MNAQPINPQPMNAQPQPAPQLTWTKSKASDSNGSCLEVAKHSNGGRYVRDSKDHGTGPVLFFTEVEWAAFLDGARNGEFD